MLDIFISYFIYPQKIMGIIIFILTNACREGYFYGVKLFQIQTACIRIYSDGFQKFFPRRHILQTHIYNSLLFIDHHEVRYYSYDSTKQILSM